jgi:hypothetical protein
MVEKLIQSISLNDFAVDLEEFIILRSKVSIPPTISFLNDPFSDDPAFCILIFLAFSNDESK